MALVTPFTSLPGLILSDLAEIKKKDATFKELKKRLKKEYSVKKIANMQKRYLRKPETFQAEFALLVNNFVRDYTLFRESYGTLLKAIIETLNVAEKSEYTQLLSIQDIIIKIDARAAEKRGEFYFPDSGRKKFANAFRRAMRDLAAQLNAEYDTLSGLAKGKRAAAGFFSRFVNARSAERKGMRAAGKLREQVDHGQEVLKHLQLELQQGVQQDFLLLMLQFVTEVAKTDELYRQLKNDLEILIQDIRNEVEDVILKIAPFIALIQNDRTAMAKVAAAREEFVRLQQQIVSALQKEELWPGYDEATIKRIMRSDIILLATLESIAKAAVQEIVADVVQRELGTQQV
ncbi:hypothetical protein HYT55_04405 [Candidatus Woesearchaeota archaeon]|nr:hypothetical protein [Candidatus Woesearchaeota archaeon]